MGMVWLAAEIFKAPSEYPAIKSWIMLAEEPSGVKGPAKAVALTMEDGATTKITRDGETGKEIMRVEWDGEYSLSYLPGALNVQKETETQIEAMVTVEKGEYGALGMGIYTPKGKITYFGKLTKEPLPEVIWEYEAIYGK